MKYGYFDDKRMEYVIRNPKTPLPWINYLGTEDFFSLKSNTCGGYSFYRDAKLLRLTRYRYNNIPPDNNGCYFYIKDEDVVWNPGWQPVKTDLDEYICRFGLGYGTFNGTKNKVNAKVLSFVPLGDNCEVNRLSIRNDSGVVKELKVFSYVEFCLWNADDDMKNFQRNLSTGEVEVEDSVIYHKTEYRERRNHYAFFSVNTPMTAFDTSRDAFLGPYNGPDRPDAVFGNGCTNSKASGWSPIGAHQVDVRLLPDESIDLIYVLGYCENPEENKWEAPGVINKRGARNLVSKYSTDGQVDVAFNDLRRYWEELLERYSVDCRDENVSSMVNIWNQY
ncbi:MAG: glycosyl transferase, partial [Lachnospiraceae bacterium]|nr:glycosyl transferase [Lachnospiraceae bacterium]